MENESTSESMNENDLARRFFVFAMIGVVVFVVVALLLSTAGGG